MTLPAPSLDTGITQAVALGLHHHQAGRFQQAEAIYRRVLAAHPDHAGCLHLLGVLAHQVGRHDAAITHIGQAIARDATVAAYHCDMGAAWIGLGRLGAAEACFRAALDRQPDFPLARNNLGNVLAEQGRVAEAEAYYRAAVALDPGYAAAHYNLGNALVRLDRPGEAAACYRVALGLRPQHAETHHALGSILRREFRLAEAEESYRVALKLRPDFAEAWNSLGNLLHQRGRYSEAAEQCRRALGLRPGFTAARFNLGTVLIELGRPGEAADCFRRVLEQRPGDGAALSMLFTLARRLCDWPTVQAVEALILRRIRDEGGWVQPFVLAFTAASSADQQRVAARFTAAVVPSLPERMVRPGAAHGHDRLRIAYLSADFHDHPVAHLIAGLIEAHDRDCFEIIGLSLAPGDGSAMHRRLAGAFDRFIDVSRLSDLDAARIMVDLEIDIVVDLQGQTQFSRLGILAHRAAPVQVQYLGYPGTSGADFIDYILADRIVVPPEQAGFYTEQVVYLPHSYQANDRRRPISVETPSRSACGLPEEGFVFACFNGSHKMSAPVFDIWMDLLRAVPGSVLWLLSDHAEARDNLRRAAEARGIAGTRLVFAHPAGLADHLARHRLADLFLDTLPYNAHTTASDALWAGLPVVTLTGDTFAGRVAASLLTAAGLPDLITGDAAAYRALALDLASRPDRLAVIRARLAVLRETCPLFDTDRFARDIERAYRTMAARAARGEPPQAFAV